MTTQDRAYLLACAENEGGRAVLCMTSHPANLATVYYFAREAAHYARLWMESDATFRDDIRESFDRIRRTRACYQCGRLTCRCGDEATR